MKKLFDFLKTDIARIVLGLIFFVSALILEQNAFGYGSLALYISALLISGYSVFFDAVRGIIRRDLLDEKFLMSIASIGAMIVGEWREGVAVMLFFLVGETFEHYAVRRSRASIRSLMDICPDEACVLTNGGEEIVDAEDVEIGSIIVIRPGERVPIDSVVISGSADVDTSSMTGEPLPISLQTDFFRPKPLGNRVTLPPRESLSLLKTPMKASRRRRALLQSSLTTTPQRLLL